MPRNRTKDEAVGELVLSEFTEPARDCPGGGLDSEVGDERRLVPVVPHRLDVVADNCGSGTERPARPVEVLLPVAGRPGRFCVASAGAGTSRAVRGPYRG